MSARLLSPAPWTTDADGRRAYLLDARGEIIAFSAAHRPLAQSCADVAVMACAPAMLGLINETLFALTEIFDSMPARDVGQIARMMRLRQQWCALAARATQPPTCGAGRRELPTFIFQNATGDQAA